MLLSPTFLLSKEFYGWQAKLPGLGCVWLASASVKGYVYMTKKYLSHILATLTGALPKFLLVVCVGCVADRFITGYLLNWSGLLCIDTCQSHSLILGNWIIWTSPAWVLITKPDWHFMVLCSAYHNDFIALLLIYIILGIFYHWCTCNDDILHIYKYMIVHV